MRRLSVEFAPRRAVRSGLWLGLSAALCLFAAEQAWFAWGAWQRVAAAEVEVASLSARLDAAMRAASAVERTPRRPPYEEDARALAAASAFPLDRVLKALERTQVIGVRVVAIETDAFDAEARVTVEFSDFATLLGFVAQLNEGEPVARWLLQQAQASAGGAGANVALVTSRWSDADRR